MAIKSLPSRELVRQLLDYNAETGSLTWFPRSSAYWNDRHAGKPAGCLKSKGYIIVRIGGTDFRAHRLVWLYVYGEPVPDIIDHVDRNPRNNRIDNLRPATKAQNAANTTRKSATGIVGVDLSDGRYRVRVGSGGRQVYIGQFGTLDEATKARFDAATLLHGEFVVP
jgi:hypothetical protein